MNIKTLTFSTSGLFGKTSHCVYCCCCWSALYLSTVGPFKNIFTQNQLNIFIFVALISILLIFFSLYIQNILIIVVVVKFSPVCILYAGKQYLQLDNENKNLYNLFLYLSMPTNKCFWNRCWFWKLLVTKTKSWSFKNVHSKQNGHIRGYDSSWLQCSC